MSSRTIRYLMLNFFFSLSLYYGFFQGVENARKVAYVIAWGCIFLGILAIFLSENMKFMNDMATESKGSYVLRTFDFIFDLCVIAVFIYGDAWATASFYLLHMLTLLSLREKVNNIRKENIEKQKEVKQIEEKKVIKF